MEKVKAPVQDVFVFKPARQADQFTCSLFVLNDLEDILRYPHFMDHLRSLNVEKRAGLSFVSDLPDFMKAAQSLSHVEAFMKNQEGVLLGKTSLLAKHEAMGFPEFVKKFTIVLADSHTGGGRQNSYIFQCYCKAVYRLHKDALSYPPSTEELV